MHNLALALKNSGHKISGSDDEIFEPSRGRLENAGLLPKQFGWFPDNINEDLDIIILGMHAKPDNPELLKAQELGLNIVSYHEFIFRQSQKKKRIVIGGSHGKTTITSMVMHVLSDMKMDFDYMVGSRIKGFDVMVRLSDAPIIILEGDEYLSSPIDRRPKFHWYKPHIAVITGIAWDHINVFPTFTNYMEQFSVFIDLIEPEGKLFYYDGDENLKNIVDNSEGNIEKIPYDMLQNETVDGVTYVLHKGKSYPLQVFGDHNLTNLNAAKNICNEIGVTDDVFFKSIESFDGASNRLELIAKSKGNFVFNDFAHAPSKVLATVEAVRKQFNDKKVVVCFELHTYSSLNSKFITQYKGCLDKADEAAVYFNPHALKIKRLAEITENEVYNAFEKDNVVIFKDSLKLQKWVINMKAEETVFLFMSSGNFDGINLNEFSKKLI